nr:hypothetical protein [Nostoc sp. CreGUA01]
PISPHSLIPLIPLISPSPPLPSLNHKVFSAWHNRRPIEPVMVVGVGLHNIFGLRLGTLAIADEFLCWWHLYLSLKILALPESAKFPRLLFHQPFLVWD